MNSEIRATPASAPIPINDFLRPTADEQSKIAAKIALSRSGDSPCSIPVHVALFFDGTNNNLYRDREGVRVGVPDAKGNPTEISRRRVAPEEADHSNVARLFRAFPQTEMRSGIFRYYMPGLGTPFPEIGEPSETQEGKAFGKGGQPRIVWALLQVLNAVSVVLDGKVLYDDRVTGTLAKEHNEKVGTTTTDAYGEQTQITHKSWFETHIGKLAAKLKNTPKPKVPSLTLSVFGFSRGAAEAAAFCHMFDELLAGKAIADIPSRISFLGVFDTVASIGGSASVGETTPMPRALFDGHWSWANRILKPLPSCVEAGRHFIASQEVRMNFPVTRLRSESGDFYEMYFPGMHSDVGGGYGPGDFGKGRGSQSSLVSQIPLAYMFKEARLKGVPFTPFNELEQAVKDDFAVNQELASAWNAYTAELGKSGGVLRKHMELYYRWRAARLSSLEKTVSFDAANDQAKQDMKDANRMLAGDLEAMKYRKTAPPRESGDNPTYEPYSLSDRDRINQWQLTRAINHQKLNDWEKWALEIFENPHPLPPDVMRFFDDYIHDSYAGFYLAGEVTEYDRRKKVSEVLKRDPRRLKGFDLRIYNTAMETEAVLKKQKTGEELNPYEKRVAEEAESGTRYPVMTDADTEDMRSFAITTQTWTRREGGGYFLPRGNYPRNGIIRFEEEINRKPSVGTASEKTAAQEMSARLMWSDNIDADLILIASRKAGTHEAKAEAEESAFA